MKKNNQFKLLLTTLSLASTLLFHHPAVAAEKDIMDITREAGYTDVLDINRPKASVVIDATSGQILWEDQPEWKHDPASIAKLMSVFLVLESLDEKGISETTKIKATAKDQAISQIYAISNSKIVAGVEYPIKDLLQMVTVPSSNVATVMLANYVSDNDAGAFVKRMNQKAHSLGMTDTIFNNCSGASASSFEGLYSPQGFDPNAGNQTTAKDLAIMVYHLLKEQPEILRYTNQPVVKTMAGTPYEETFETYNYSLPGAKYGFEGVDGLKTGSGPESAFNYIATAKRGQTRVIEVILGVGNWEDQNGEYYRHPFGNALLQKAFDTYETKKLLSSGKHKIDGKVIELKSDVYGTLKKNEKPDWEIKGHRLYLKNQRPLISDKLTTGIAYQEAAEKTEKKAKHKFFFHKKHASTATLLGTSLLSFVGWKLSSSVKGRATSRRKRTMLNTQLLKWLSWLSLGSALILLLNNLF